MIEYTLPPLDEHTLWHKFSNEVPNAFVADMTGLVDVNSKYRAFLMGLSTVVSDVKIFRYSTVTFFFNTEEDKLMFILEHL